MVDELIRYKFCEREFCDEKIYSYSVIVIFESSVSSVNKIIFHSNFDKITNTSCSANTLLIL